MNKKSTISIICIVLVLGLCLIAFEVVKLWAYVSLGLAWVAAFFALTLQAMCLSKGEEERSLKRGMLLGGIGMAAIVLIKATVAGYALVSLQTVGNPDSFAFSLLILNGPVLLFVKIVGTICAIAAIPTAYICGDRSRCKHSYGMLALLLILIAAPIFLLLAITGGLNLAFNCFLWIGFFIWLYSFCKIEAR